MRRILQLKKALRAALFVLLLSVVGMTKAQTENITFADANVKAICVANWDTSGDGELNQNEAAIVTSLDGVFMFDDGITSFDELLYFTGLTSIGEDEFNSCTSLVSISIPNLVTSIEDAAFSDCSSLALITSYAFTPPVLGNNVFDNVPSAVVVKVPCHTSELYQAANGWSYISNYEDFMFDLCPIVFADDNVKAICVAHWDTNDDGELNYAEAAAVTNLGTYFKSTAITSFDELEYFTSLTSLPNTAFYGCTSLTSITLPSSVSALGNGSFYNCTSLATITVNAETPPTVGTNAFKNVPTNMVVHVPYGTYDAYHNADGWSVFSILDPCPIVFADSRVKSLCVSNWDTNGDGELSYAEAAAVTDLGKVFYYKSYITSFDELQYFIGLTSIGYEAFYYCSALTSIEIPNSVTFIDSWAFELCSSLTSIEIPNSVTSIGNYAFYLCSGLTSVVISNSVTYIGKSVFSNCRNLEQIIVASGNTVYDSRDNCNAIIETSTNVLISGCKNTVIPNSVTSIGYEAFYYCRDLSSIEIPNSVTLIGNDAFAYCSGLTSITVLADNPPASGSDAFYSVNKGIPVYVPCGSLEAYQNASVWYEFNNYMPATACNSGEITAIAYPEEGGSVTGEGFYDGGVICTITAMANPGYSFINWTKDGLGVSNSEAYSFYVAGDASFTANFVQEGTIITFADSNVKALCVANWDTNGDGELSYAEAAAVTNLGTVFNNKRSITNFDELQYFVGLTSIGSNAFQNCNGLTSIAIPNSVKAIGSYAFQYCNGLTSIAIPNSVRSIGNYAFSGCSSLTSIAIPNSMTTIGSNAFSGCSGLTSIEIPNSVTIISDYAFSFCSSLEQIIVASGNTAYDSRDNCNAIIETSTNKLVAGCKNTVIPNSVTTIGNTAFSGCTNLMSIEIPNSVTSIGSNAFSYCTGLTSIAIPHSVTSIGSSAFGDCTNLTSIEIPNSVTSIGSSAFGDCTNLTSIEIPNSVTSIEGYVFYACSGLTSIDIPNSVTSIGDAAFYNCSGLKSLIVLAENPPTIGDDAFYRVSKGIPVYVPCGSVEAYTAAHWGGFRTFVGLCAGEITVTANPAEGGTVTGGGYYENGTTFTITATAAPGYSFINWTKDGIGVPYPETYSFYVTGDAFYVATFAQGTNITFADANVKALCVANWDTDGDGELSYVEAAAVTDLGTVFKNKSNITTFDELQYFVGLTSIGSAFRNCSGLTSIKIPNSVTSIGGSAFYQCTGLTSIEIPNSVTSIGNYAFYYCNGLISIEIPNSVTSIGEWAFEHCIGLTSIDIPNSVTSIGDHAFYYCSGLTSIEIPNSVTSIGSSTFSSCSGLTSIKIPNSVTSIGEWAFNNCNVLTSVIVLADNPPTISNNAFSPANLGIPVYVPCGKVEAYTTIHWGGFGNFVGLCAGEITVMSNPVEGGTVMGGGYYEISTTFTLSATANPGYSFINWTKDGVGVSNSETYSFYVAGDDSYVANFIQGTNITFADANVKNICVTNWDTDGDGELSYSEAAAVTDLGSVFRNNSDITIFDELQYFVGLTSISTGSGFNNCSSLTSIEIPNSVIYIGSSAFYNCSSLTSIGIPNSVTSIGSTAFKNCSSLTSIEIPTSVSSIGYSAFENCSGLTSIEIPNSVLSIGSSAFYGCSSLTSIEIPNSVTSIGNSAFSGCTNLEQIIVASGNTVYDSRNNCNAIIETSTNKLVTGCKNTVIPNSVTSIGNYAFEYCSGLTSIEIPNSVTSIGEKAFYFCIGLTSIQIPNSVTSIGSVAFCGCSGLASIEIPNSMTSIRNATFSSCSGLSSIEIPNSVTYIEYWAFSDCSGLTSMTVYAETPPTIYSSTFNNCPKSIPLYVPCECVEAYQSAAYWNQFTNIQELCTQSQTITLSEGWNWISTYIDMENNDGLSQLTDCLGTNGLQIITTGGSLIYRGGSWIGSITSLSNTKAYKIKTNAPVTVTITGSQAVDPANCEIQIMNGWNWIAYPLSESKTVAEALAGFEPSNGDNIKTQGGSAVYRNGNWLPNTFTFEPGKGYTYKSMATQPKTLIFQTGSKQ